ncbi:MAG: hypothetical protein BAJATHORv1_60075 [Candidatus Thorarchaeota archaeon]|nr:MAG: hypothetical protein BAJATHORv1_60075 [Candidatus Thorarchaeota archaeon]
MDYTNKTSVHVTYPIVGALYAAERFIGKTESVEKWNSTSDIQRHFMSDFYEKCKSEIPKIPEIESIADRDVSVINAWLKLHGFDIQLSPVPPSGLATACKLDVTGYWNTPGMSSQILGYDDATYPCVQMMYGYDLLNSDVVEEHVVRISTESSDEVCMVMVDEVPSGFDMIEYAESVQNSLKPCNLEYDGLRFPMIDLDLEGSLEWLVGLGVDIASSDISCYEIAEALQQTKLKMNNEGFRVKSAAALSMEKCAPPQITEPYIINRPFLMWIRRPTLARPLLVGYFNTDAWKDPSGLEM